MKERIEIRDGKEYRVVSLPPDTRLQPSRVKKRQQWQALSSRDKKRLIKSKTKSSSSTPRYKTIAEGFAAKAEDEQKKIDMQHRIVQVMRGEL